MLGHQKGRESKAKREGDPRTFFEASFVGIVLCPRF